MREDEWDATGAIHDLPPPERDLKGKPSTRVPSSIAHGVNDAGHVVGISSDAGGSFAVMWAPSTDPVAKADCWNGGWETYGFKNQGQCIRFLETGEDGR